MQPRAAVKNSNANTPIWEDSKPKNLKPNPTFYKKEAPGLKYLHQVFQVSYRQQQKFC